MATIEDPQCIPDRRGLAGPEDTPFAEMPRQIWHLCFCRLQALLCFHVSKEALVESELPEFRGCPIIELRQVSIEAPNHRVLYWPHIYKHVAKLPGGGQAI
jgi:hypothetical protein